MDKIVDGTPIDIPCPNCGEMLSQWRLHMDIMGNTAYRIQCRSCGCMSKVSNIPSDVLDSWIRASARWIVGKKTQSIEPDEPGPDPDDDSCDDEDDVCSHASTDSQCNHATMDTSMMDTVDLIHVADDAIRSYHDRWIRFANAHPNYDPKRVWDGYMSEVENLLDNLSQIQEDARQ